LWWLFTADRRYRFACSQRLNAWQITVFSKLTHYHIGRLLGLAGAKF
jgi:hypothetical protein